GAHQWRSFERWPPTGTEEKNVFLLPRGRASFFPEHIRPSKTARDEGGVFDEFVSDPAHPVPFTERVGVGMAREYMTDDQRFAARRPDVLTWQTAELTVSTTGTDADWIVKLIDVFPSDAKDNARVRGGEHMSGYQMLVRSE